MVRNIQNIEDDIALAKRIIETVLYTDEDIVEILNNPEIDPTCPEELIGENIFPFVRIPGIQDVSKNFICYSIDDVSANIRNDIMKQQYIQFVVFVHKDLVKTKYGICRHDLLGLIK